VDVAEDDGVRCAAPQVRLIPTDAPAPAENGDGGTSVARSGDRRSTDDGTPPADHRGEAFPPTIYEEWYEAIARSLPDGPGAIVEIGSGAGFLDRRVPEVIRSEVFRCSNVQIILDARSLPFYSGALCAIAMTDVFHHLPDARAFLRETARCVRPGGALVMIEPWVTRWSTLVYRNFHHEPFEPQAREWEFTSSGPLSGANGALPWIVFERDAETFRREFPQWRLSERRLIMPFRYLLSGGLSQRSVAPAFSFELWRAFESRLEPMMPRLAMFALIVVERV
jgi:SAM-dependent methyltransferase